MNKIPVFGTVSRTYGFLIGDFLTIVRLTWAPLLAAAALQYYYGGDLMTAAASSMQSTDRSLMAAHMPAQFLLGLAQFVAGVIALVALLRVVISGDRKPGLFVYFWFGSAEIRIIVVSVLLLVATIAGFIGIALVLGILGALAAAVPVLGILILIACIVLFFAVLWAALRLSLISAVIVAESGLGVERSWALMRGNALRMFVILLLTVLPLAIIASFVGSALLGNDFPSTANVMAAFQAMLNPPGGDAQAAATAFNEAVKHWQVALFEAYHKHWLELSVFGFVYSMISTAIAAGVTGSAYVSAAGKQG